MRVRSTSASPHPVPPCAAGGTPPPSCSGSCTAACSFQCTMDCVVCGTAAVRSWAASQSAPPRAASPGPSPPWLPSRLTSSAQCWRRRGSQRCPPAPPYLRRTPREPSPPSADVPGCRPRCDVTGRAWPVPRLPARRRPSGAVHGSQRECRPCARVRVPLHLPLSQRAGVLPGHSSVCTMPCPPCCPVPTPPLLSCAACCPAGCPSWRCTLWTP